MLDLKSTPLKRMAEKYAEDGAIKDGGQRDHIMASPLPQSVLIKFSSLCKRFFAAL
jgi:hypothetical protein